MAYSHWCISVLQIGVHHLNFSEMQHVATGVEDDGYPRGLTQADMDVSLASLRAMAEEVHAATTLLRKAAGTRKRHCAIVRVHKLCVDDVGYTDLRIAGEYCLSTPCGGSIMTCGQL